MKSIALILGTGLLAYTIEIVLVAGFLAYLIQKRGKKYSWFTAIPLLMLFFAINELFYIPAIINANVTFTINNQELANFWGIGQNESLTDFMLEDFISISIWLIEASLAYGLALILTRKQTMIS